jgi:hypothetical protein
MRKLWMVSVIGIFWAVRPAGAQVQEASYNAGVPSASSLSDKPAAPGSSPDSSGLFFLRDQDLILPASQELEVPHPPQLGPDGKILRTVEDTGVPEGDALGSLTGIAFVQQIERFNQRENQPEKYHWHTTSTGWRFCHYRDYEGNDWYGWNGDEKFQWVLCWNGHFWWKDTIAERWLCFDKGNWWWPESGDSQRVWVYHYGSYYLCDANGAVMDEKGEIPGELRSGWKRQFQGDLARNASAFDDDPDHDGDHHPGLAESPGEERAEHRGAAQGGEPAAVQVSVISGQP